MPLNSHTVMPLTPAGPVRSWLARLRRGDESAYLITLACAAAVVAITAMIAFELYRGSAQSRHAFGWRFLVDQEWDPVSGQFGALPFLYGTLTTSLLALLIAVPLGVGAAIFLAELATPRISNAMTFLIELLAAVPSVIFGLLGVFILVPALREIEPAMRHALGWTQLMRGPFYGVSIFAASVVLAVMIIPFIISVSREVILQVPAEQREAGALGATRWENTWDVVIPFARKGILASIFLALARALGETMAVTMVIGNDPKIGASIFAPGYSIAAVIANEFTEATGTLYPAALIELGLVLFALTIAINALARLLVFSTTKRGAT